MIAAYEFCALVQLNKIIPFFVFQFYSLIALLSYYRLETEYSLATILG
jgi:hypothetical protein